jgi:FG-GAP repeat
VPNFRLFPLVFPLGCLLAGSVAAQCETAKLHPAYQLERSFLGSYIDLEGDLAVVGSRNPDGRNVALLYGRSGPQWILLQEVKAFPVGGPFGSPVGITGDTVFLAQYQYALEAGAVYVFERSGGVWSKTQKLQPISSMPDSNFGRRLAVDGDRAVIAAPMDATYAYRGGAAFVFERVGGSWVETARLEAAEPRGFGFFGLSVAIEGNLLVVGEPGYVLGNSTGYVYVYRRGPTGWALEQRLNTPPHPYVSGYGYAVDVNQGRIAVGAFQDSSHGGPYLGSVFLYEHQSEWVQVDKLWSTHPDGDDYFGTTVELKGSRLAVGSGAVEIPLGERVHVYRNTLGGWQLQTVLAPHDDIGSPWVGQRVFGSALAIDGEDLWVGSPADTEQGGPDMAGAAYVYTWDPLTFSYCGPANPNSTGFSGVLEAQGCGTVVQNDLVLSASQLPPNRLGLFLVGRQADFVPLVSGSQGNLCLGGPLGRYTDQVGNSGPLGRLELAVDLGALPVPGGTHSAALGETWRFQCWYRDANPGPTSNLTDALALMVR